MIVRALDGNHDWTFGKGRNSYKSNNDAIVQNINTRLNSFVGDCFFDANFGIDWWNLLGAKSQIAIELAITTIILNTDGVTGLAQLSVTLDTSRKVTIVYQVVTVYSISKNLGGSLTVGGF
jgi:hypothetical protein